MNSLQKRVSRIQNVLILTAKSQLAGQPGWTLGKLSEAICSSPRATKDFLRNLILLGHVSRTGDTYKFTKPIPPTSKGMYELSVKLATNMHRNIYATRATLLSKLTDEELIRECEKRNLVKSNDY